MQTCLIHIFVIIADEEVESPTMLVSLPQCDSETGDYTPVQSQGDLSWCVTPDGQPILETFTRGKVSCSSNGTNIYHINIMIRIACGMLYIIILCCTCVSFEELCS